MKLELDPLDLKPEYQRKTLHSVDQVCSTREVSFDKLKPQVQTAVRAVGAATFFAWDRKTYNAIYPPQG